MPMLPRSSSPMPTETIGDVVERHDGEITQNRVDISDNVVRVEAARASIEVKDHELRTIVARHDEQIRDHDEVLRELKDHLAALVDQVSKFQTKILIAAAVFFAGTHQGQNILHLIGFG